MLLKTIFKEILGENHCAKHNRWTDNWKGRRHNQTYYGIDGRKSAAQPEARADQPTGNLAESLTIADLFILHFEISATDLKNVFKQQI